MCVFETVGPSEYCWVILFLGRNRPVNPSSRCAGDGQWRMCDGEEAEDRASKARGESAEGASVAEAEGTKHGE